ncbi:MAG: tRNA dihydrouridine synthase DusB [Clostridia bacterium]|nr:tRNA dihydrouridine synthase DusB [Clostridia bacterium]
MNIGTLQPENNVFVAPMAGVTDLAYRTILQEMGAGMLYTEMVSAKALYFGDRKTKQLMQGGTEKAWGIQIFGSNPAVMAYGAQMAEQTGCSLIDINMGCPVPKVAGNGDGSALMKQPRLAGQVMEAVKRAVSVPVTAKIRSGWNAQQVNAVEVAAVLQESGADAVTVHGRTREQMYRGKADWNLIAAVKDALRIPVIGNGDIMEADDAAAMLERTGCDGVMVARGVMGNPWLVRQCLQKLDGQTPETVSADERVAMALRHVKLLADTKGEKIGILESRSHLSWYLKGLYGAAQARERLNRAGSVQEIENILQTVLQEQTA